MLTKLAATIGDLSSQKYAVFSLSSSLNRFPRGKSFTSKTRRTNPTARSYKRLNHQTPYLIQIDEPVPSQSNRDRHSTAQHGLICSPPLLIPWTFLTSIIFLSRLPKTPPTPGSTYDLRVLSVTPHLDNLDISPRLFAVYLQVHHPFHN